MIWLIIVLVFITLCACLMYKVLRSDSICPKCGSSMAIESRAKDGKEVTSFRCTMCGYEEIIC